MVRRNPFLDHPRSVGETYLEHMHVAAAFGFRMLLGAIACLIHAVLPFLFERTGSDQIRELHRRMIANRTVRHTPIDEIASPAIEAR